MKQQIAQELAIANAQQLINKINENVRSHAAEHMKQGADRLQCFEKCVKQPGASLSSSEEVSLNSNLECRLIFRAVSLAACLSTWPLSTRPAAPTSLVFPRSVATLEPAFLNLFEQKAKVS